MFGEEAPEDYSREDKFSNLIVTICAPLLVFIHCIIHTTQPHWCAHNSVPIYSNVRDVFIDFYFHFSKDSTYSAVTQTVPNSYLIVTLRPLLQVKVMDINDHYPVFFPSTYSTEIQENTSPGTDILQVSATDDDDGYFGDITYRIK